MLSHQLFDLLHEHVCGCQEQALDVEADRSPFVKNGAGAPPTVPTASQR